MAEPSGKPPAAKAFVVLVEPYERMTAREVLDAVLNNDETRAPVDLLRDHVLRVEAVSRED